MEVKCNECGDTGYRSSGMNDDQVSCTCKTTVCYWCDKNPCADNCAVAPLRSIEKRGHDEVCQLIEQEIRKRAQFHTGVSHHVLIDLAKWVKSQIK